jgi:hypothetical protein
MRPILTIPQRGEVPTGDLLLYVVDVVSKMKAEMSSVFLVPRVQILAVDAPGHVLQEPIGHQTR